MGIRVECDWCRNPIEAGTTYVTVAIEGKIDREDVGGPARVFCGGAAGCARRLLTLLDGNPQGRVDMGLEWQLVPAGGAENDSHGNRTPAPRPVAADADLAEFLETLAPSPKAALRRAFHSAGVATLDQAAGMTDDELMEIRGIGWPTRTRLRRFIDARDAARAGAVPV
jgi:hypothetical protein